MLIGKGLMLASLILPVAGGAIFFRKQNRANQMGGGISKPKVIWLFFALYLYFVLPVLCYVVLGRRLSPETKVSLGIFTGLLYFRALLQPYLMYRLKIWIPAFGIAYNLLCGSFLFYQILQTDFYHLVTHAYDAQIFWLLGIGLGVLITDSFYALFFYKVVGNNTQGEKAIWYASATNPAFDAINQITFRLNVLFISALVLWFLKMLLL